MDSSFGRGMGDALITAAIFLFVAGALVGVGGYFLISWLVSHISIAWR